MKVFFLCILIRIKLAECIGITVESSIVDTNYDFERMSQ